MARGKRQSDNIKFLKKIIIFCISFIVLYTVVQVCLSYFLQIELSPILTDKVYNFFGTELVVCAFIKIIDEVLDKRSKNKEDSVG